MITTPTNKKPETNTTVAVAISAALEAAHLKAEDLVSSASDTVENSAKNFSDSSAPIDAEESPFAGILDDTDEDEARQDDFGTLEIHSKKCLMCKALVPAAEKTYKACHFTSGNTNCPAQSARIILRVPVEEIGMRFKVAKAANDLARLGKLYAHLATFEDWYQERVTEYLKENGIM